jgi:hypothetical protein
MLIIQMITIEDHMPKPDLPNWENLNRILDKSNDILMVAHISRQNKYFLTFESYHFVLRKLEADRNTLSFLTIHVFTVHNYAGGYRLRSQYNQLLNQGPQHPSR